MEARSKQRRVGKEMGSEDGNTTRHDFPAGDRRANNPKEGGRDEGHQSPLDGRCIAREERLLKGRLCTKDPAVI